MKIIDWNIMYDGLNTEIMKGIIIYGASGTGKQAIMLLSELGLTDYILSVIDSDQKKWGKEWMNFKVSCPETLNRLPNDSIIVITSVYLRQICQFLQNELQCKQRICSFFSFRQGLHYDIINQKSDYISSTQAENYKLKYKLWNNIIPMNPAPRIKAYQDMLKCIMEQPVSILLCGIPKTGNISLRQYFDKNLKLNVAFTRHATYYDQNTLEQLKAVLSLFKNHEIRIISGVREPIERIISHQWQKICWPCYQEETCISDFIDEAYAHFTDLKSSENEIKTGSLGGFYADIANWFQDQIEQAMDIDVFQYPFDQENGYSIIKKKNIQIFLYRLDKLSNLEKEIGAFIGDASYKIAPSNVADQKNYALAYHEYLKHVKIKKEFFNFLVNSKGMAHFYSKEECNSYKKKWKDQLV